MRVFSEAKYLDYCANSPDCDDRDPGEWCKGLDGVEVSSIPKYVYFPPKGVYEIKGTPYLAEESWTEEREVSKDELQ